MKSQNTDTALGDDLLPGARAIAGHLKIPENKFRWGYRQGHYGDAVFKLPNSKIIWGRKSKLDRLHGGEAVA